MSVNLYQIFHGHDGQKYKTLAHSSAITDDTANAVASRVCTLLRSKSDNESTCIKFEDGEYYCWAQASPGRRDLSHRPTMLYHILLCKKNAVDSVTAKKDIVFYNRLKKALPKDKSTADEIIIADGEFKQYPIIESSALLSNLQYKSKYKKLWCILIAVAVAIVVILSSTIIQQQKNEEVLKTEITSKNKLLDDSQKEVLNTILEKFGLKKEDNPSIDNVILRIEKDKIEKAISRFKDKNKKEILREIAEGIGEDPDRFNDTEDVIQYIKEMTPVQSKSGKKQTEGLKADDEI